MLQAYSTYALGAVVIIFSVLNYDAFAGARDYDTEIIMPAACTEIVYGTGVLHLRNGTNSTHATTVTLCRSAHLSKVTVENPAPCMLQHDLATKGCYTRDDDPIADFARPRDSNGDFIPPKADKIGNRVVEHVCDLEQAETSCERAKSLAGWALVLTLGGCVAAAIGLHHAVYQAGFVLFSFAAIAILMSWDAVMTMHTETMLLVKESDGVLTNVNMDTVHEPMLPAVLISVLVISSFVHVYGYVMKDNGYQKMKSPTNF